MTDLSPQAASLVRAGRQALMPSATDRLRVSDALRARLGDAALPVEILAVTSLSDEAKPSAAVTPRRGKRDPQLAVEALHSKQ